MSTTTTDYYELPIDTVMDYYAKDFTTEPDKTILSTEWFLDPVKKRVIFRIIKDKKPTK